MKYSKGFKNPKKIKHWSKSDLKVTWTGDEIEDYKEQIVSRGDLLVEVLSHQVDGLSNKQIKKLSTNVLDYIQWSLLREKVMIGSLLPDTLHPRDFEGIRPKK